jgi:hypothetical protein
MNEHECFSLAFPEGTVEFTPSPENEIVMTARTNEGHITNV